MKSHPPKMKSHPPKNENHRLKIISTVGSYFSETEIDFSLRKISVIKLKFAEIKKLMRKLYNYNDFITEYGLFISGIYSDETKIINFSDEDLCNLLTFPKKYKTRIDFKT